MAQLQKAIAQLMGSRAEQRPPQPADDPAAAEAVAAPAPVPSSDEELFRRALYADQPAVGGGADGASRAAAALAFLRTRPGPTATRIFLPERQRDGWSSAMAVVETALADRPFVVDTLRAWVEEEGGEVRLLLHPILGIERDADGQLRRLAPAGEALPLESFVHAEIANLTPSPVLEQRLRERLDSLLRATDDYAAMRARLGDAAERLRATALPPPWEEERQESAAFLDWLGRKRFVFLGYREYDVRVGGDPTCRLRAGSGFGILREPAPSRWTAGGPLPTATALRLSSAPPVVVSKTHAISPIHRHVAMDDIAIKEVDAAGTVVGVRRLLGLFTAGAEAADAREIPILRRRLADILHRHGAVEDSHDSRMLTDLFNSFPREELLTSRVDDLHLAMRAIVAAESTLSVDLFCRPDAMGRGLFVLVLLPRARYSTELGEHVTSAVLGRLTGPLLDEHLALDERSVVRLHYHVGADPAVLEAPPVAALRDDLGGLLRTWDDALGEALTAAAPRAELGELLARYRAAFPAAYKAGTDIGTAARDVRCLEALRASGSASIELASAQPGSPATLTLYTGDHPVVLSDFIPVLEHLGLRVMGEDVITLTVADGERVAIHRFAVEAARGAGLDAERAGPRLVAALHAVRARHTVSDRLNALVLSADLDWRAVAVLRAYAAHAAQTGVGPLNTLVEALIGNPDCAGALHALFAARFDPGISALAPVDRLAKGVALAAGALDECIAAVPALAHDRALRGLAAAVSATVRTTAYSAAPGAPVAFKIDLTRLQHLPPPAVLETWVHGVEVQGVHLRSGPVARGGLRCSDRPDDFRTEVLGLLRTQVVKNALIVPVGAKGGFVVGGAGCATAEPARVEAAYRAFVESLLALTDTVDRGEVKRPPGLLTYDGADPYLVVAADKGTAALSDVANAIAAARGFWLGDAFASGGRHGYDHRALAITARGAWECARQHFRELGRDLDRDAVRVAGIGDMSGDVFGNGLLRSRHLLLVAAFDHRHVFLDPSPDAERAFAERQRLFGLARSSWADYAPTALSAGGGVFARDAKAVALSPEARGLLEIDDPAPSGEAVVRAILRLPVDLLWNGGIGTYVKASDETDAEVGDPATDALRIDARELRATVVVEGGNLGLTQRARIEYALAGGRIDTDAIDNSGGVDCSDHEVNLKLALQPLLASGALTVDARNALLAELADPVCGAVLAHNRSQARALQLDQMRSRTRLPLFRDLISILEAEAGLERQGSHMPTREALRVRRGLYPGLTRPELAVLLAHTKLDLHRRLLQSPLCDDPSLAPLLNDYFPAALRDRFPRAVAQHPLRREIVAVQLAGRLIDGMGMTFLVRAVRDTGSDVIDIVRAWVAARLLGDGDGLEGELAADAERLTVAADTECALRIERACEEAVTSLVPSLRGDQPIEALIRPLREPVGVLLEHWPEWLGARRRSAHDADRAALERTGVRPALAGRVLRFGGLAEALEIARIAAAAGVPLPAAAEVYGEVGAAFELDWLGQAVVASLSGSDRWEARAASGLIDRLRATRRRLTLDVLAERRGGDPPAAARVEAYVEGRRDQVDVVLGLIHDLRAVAQPDLPALLVLLREIDRLIDTVASGRP
jgi:glutamate dehydrogenase